MIFEVTLGDGQRYQFGTTSWLACQTRRSSMTDQPETLPPTVQLLVQQLWPCCLAGWLRQVPELLTDLERSATGKTAARTAAEQRGKARVQLRIDGQSDDGGAAADYAWPALCAGRYAGADANRAAGGSGRMRRNAAHGWAEAGLTCS